MRVLKFSALVAITAAIAGCETEVYHEREHVYHAAMLDPGPSVMRMPTRVPQLARRIVTRGRRVFCSDAGADHAFVRDVQLRAADLEPFLRRTRRVKLESIAR